MSLVSTQPEVPDGERFVVSDWLLHQVGEGGEVKPDLPSALEHELPSSGFGHGKAELIPADALRLQLKAGGTLEVVRGDPKPPCFFVDGTDLACSVVVDDSGMGLSGPGGNTGHRKKETE